MKTFLILFAFLAVCPAVFAFPLQEGEFEMPSGDELQRVRISFLSSGASFLLDSAKRTGSLGFGVGGDMSIELGVCPSISAFVSCRVLYVWYNVVAPIRVGIKIRFPGNLSSNDWFLTSNAPRIKGASPYIKFSGGGAYAGVMGNPGQYGWVEHSEKRELYSIGAAAGFEVRISDNSFVFFEADLFSIAAKEEIPAVFAGFLSGLIFSF